MNTHHIGVIAAVVVSAACSTPTTLSNVWRDPNYSAAPMRKVLVVGRVNEETNRRALEDSYASALASHGVQAMQSYRVFPDVHADREVVRKHIDAEGYDGALVTTFKGIHTQTIIDPGTSFYGYYGTGWGGYVYTDQIVNVETTLWDPHTGKLVWSASSDTDNPSSSNDAISSIVTKVVSTLTDERLIPPKNGAAVATRGISLYAY